MIFYQYLSAKFFCSWIITKHHILGINQTQLTHEPIQTQRCRLTLYPMSLGTALDCLQAPWFSGNCPDKNSKTSCTLECLRKNDDKMEIQSSVSRFNTKTIEQLFLYWKTEEKSKSRLNKHTNSHSKSIRIDMAIEVTSPNPTDPTVFHNLLHRYFFSEYNPFWDKPIFLCLNNEWSTIQNGGVWTPRLPNKIVKKKSRFHGIILMEINQFPMKCLWKCHCS